MNAIARWRGWTTPGRSLAALIVTGLVLSVAGAPATAADDGLIEASYTYTDTQTVTVDETYTIGEFVGHGSASATASATVTKTVRKATDWEAYYYSIWESYLAAVQEAHDKAVAEAQPIAKKEAEEDARAKADAGVTFSYTATESETVTATEDYTIGDVIGHGSATVTASATESRTVTKPTSWEAYYYAVVESSDAAKASAKDKAREQAKAEALDKAKADAEAQVKAEAEKPQPAPPAAGSGQGSTPTTPTAPSCGTDPTKADGSKWECTFSDDFRGTSLDRNKWTPVTTENSRLSYGDCWVDSPDNIKVSDGAAQLSTRKVENEVSCGDGVKSNYTSASLSSVGKFSQAYGRYEIRAAMPKTDGQGLHSALWLWPDAQKYGATWPASGEIDIAEFYSKYPDRLIPALHYNSTLPWSTRTNNECLIEDPTKYHTYTLEWTPQSLTIGMDGQTCVEHKISPLAPLSGAAPFDKPFYVNLTQTLGSGDNTLPAGADIGDDVTLKVDYVRVWK